MLNVSHHAKIQLEKEEITVLVKISDSCLGGRQQLRIGGKSFIDWKDKIKILLEDSHYFFSLPQWVKEQKK